MKIKENILQKKGELSKNKPKDSQNKPEKSKDKRGVFQDNPEILSDKRYHTINEELKRQFAHKVIKLSLDGGFTCPTRDGVLGSRGCIFCSPNGSGEFTNYDKNVQYQMQSQIKLLENKWKDCKYLAYFQNFTGTYKRVEDLDELYASAIAHKDVLGLAIATRPDCLGDDVLRLLDAYNKKTYLFVELGLQSIHEKTSEFIRRGYRLEVFERALEQLNALGIRTVVHTILGFPTENWEEMLETYRYLSKKQIWGIKISQLNVLKHTDLAKYYEKHPFAIMDADEYIHLVCDIIEELREDIIIHRLTGDGAKDALIAPNWVRNKRYVLNGIDKELRRRNTRQGSKFV